MLKQINSQNIPKNRAKNINISNQQKIAKIKKNIEKFPINAKKLLKTPISKFFEKSRTFFPK